MFVFRNMMPLMIRESRKDEDVAYQKIPTRIVVSGFLFCNIVIYTITNILVDYFFILYGVVVWC